MAEEPAHTDALPLLGLIALGAGQMDAAEALVEQSGGLRPALALGPDNIAARIDLGMTLEALGRGWSGRSQRRRPWRETAPGEDSGAAKGMTPRPLPV